MLNWLMKDECSKLTSLDLKIVICRLKSRQSSQCKSCTVHELQKPGCEIQITLVSNMGKLTPKAYKNKSDDLQL